MADLIVKDFKHSDEIREHEKTKIEIVKLDNQTIMRATFQPGWKWSTCLKPAVKTNSCEAPHFSIILSGKLRIIMDDNSQQDLTPGMIASIPPGHDALVIGDEPCVIIDLKAGEIFGK